MPIQLKEENKKKLIASLQRYFDEELDMEIGELKSELILDYLMQEAGSVIYNQAIRDAQAYITDRVDDMDGTLYHPEFTYWEK